MGARLRVRFPSHVEVTGITLNNQRTKIKELLIPLHFTSSKGATAAAFIELVIDNDDEAEEAKKIERPVSDHQLMVSGKDGTVRIQSTRNEYVEPAFLSQLLKGESVSGEDDDEEDDDTEHDNEDGDEDDEDDEEGDKS